jgi:hypothetical protein
VLGAGGRRCCPTNLDRRSGALNDERTEASEPGSEPTGESDRSAQRRQYSKSLLALHPLPLKFLREAMADFNVEVMTTANPSGPRRSLANGRRGPW